MASKKKSKQKDQSSKSQNNGLLGGRLNGIAVALLTALVTEIVQQVIDRLFSSNAQPSSADDKPVKTEPAKANLQPPKAKADDHPVSAEAVSDRANPAKPMMQDVLKTIQTAVQEATPRLNEAIAVLQASSNVPQPKVATLIRDAVMGTKESLDTAASAAPNLDGWISSAMNATQSAMSSISTANTDKPKDKGKKSKGKKSKGKKSKK